MRASWIPMRDCEPSGARRETQKGGSSALPPFEFLPSHSGARAARTSDVQLHIGESRDSGFDAEPVIGPRFARTRWHRPGMTFTLKPSRAHLDLLVGEEDLPGVLDDILCLPSAVRRFPTFHFHHPHLAHAAGSGNAQNLAGLIARQIAHHV